MQLWIEKIKIQLVGPLGVDIAGYGQMVLVVFPLYFQLHKQ